MGKRETEPWREGAHEKRMVVLTKVQENLLLLPLHEQLVVGQEVCVLLLPDLLNDGFCLLELLGRVSEVMPGNRPGTGPGTE